MSDDVQDGIVVELGPTPGSITDYSCDFSEFVIEETRATVTKAATPGSPNVEQKAAAASQAVRMAFLATPHATTGLWHELWVASQTASGELYFEVRYSDEVVSASNPKRTGYIVVTSLLTGAAAWQARRQSAVVPARSVSAPLSS